MYVKGGNLATRKPMKPHQSTLKHSPDVLIFISLPDKTDTKDWICVIVTILLPIQNINIINLLTDNRLQQNKRL